MSSCFPANSTMFSTLMSMLSDFRRFASGPDRMKNPSSAAESRPSPAVAGTSSSGASSFFGAPCMPVRRAQVRRPLRG